ncbi:MAG: hypothetical protein WAM58_17210 [Candidatus Acidiferrum sp.]
MNESELKFPLWHAPFQELIVEFTLHGLPEKLQKAEALVQVRLQQLDHGSDHREEKIALQDALSILRVMKQEGLGSVGENK